MYQGLKKIYINIKNEKPKSNYMLVIQVSHIQSKGEAVMMEIRKPIVAFKMKVLVIFFELLFS